MPVVNLDVEWRAMLIRQVGAPAKDLQAALAVVHQLYRSDEATQQRLCGFNAQVEHAGFIPALIVLIFGSAAAGTEFRFVEVLLLAVGLTAFSVALFIYGLGLPYPLLTGW